jgi:hypothetical protein
MVDRVMVLRLRLVVGVVAALAVVLVPALASPPVGPAPDELVDVAVTASEPAAVLTTIAARAPRPSAPIPLALVTVVAVTAVLAVTRAPRRPFDLLRRRLHDVGDDWRSLLLGAPPALA